MLITVYKHKGINIQIRSPATSDKLDYTIDHQRFKGFKFKLIQDAINSIDSNENNNVKY